MGKSRKNILGNNYPEKAIDNSGIIWQHVSLQILKNSGKKLSKFERKTKLENGAKKAQSKEQHGAEMKTSGKRGPCIIFVIHKYSLGFDMV